MIPLKFAPMFAFRLVAEVFARLILYVIAALYWFRRKIGL